MMSNRTCCYLFALLLFCASFARAQVSPFQGLGNVQFFDNNGKTLTAGVLYSFVAGTSTQQATFTDSTGTILNPNPIPFGSGARVSIWLTSSALYKFVLCVQNDGAFCAPADVLFSVDQVPGNVSGITSGSPFTGTFISGSTTPATTGILRLASGDTICWRNTANTGNLCISKDTSDILTWSGSTIKLPEGTCTAVGTGFDYICGNGATHHLSVSNNLGAYGSLPLVTAAGISGHLAGFATNGIDLQDSGATPPASTTVTFSATPTFTATSQDQLFTMLLTGNVTGSTLVTTGLPIPSLLSFEITQDPTGGRTFAWPANVLQAPTVNPSPNALTMVHLIWDGTNAYPPSPLPSVQAASLTQLGSDQAIAANTATTFLSKSVTMPSSGCPCRAFVSYGTFINAGASGIDVVWVDDGTNQFATSEVLVTGSASNYGTSASAFSTGTYANGASVTFANRINASNSGGVTVKQSNNDGTPNGTNTWINVAIFSSN